MRQSTSYTNLVGKTPLQCRKHSIKASVCLSLLLLLALLCVCAFTVLQWALKYSFSFIKSSDIENIVCSDMSLWCVVLHIVSSLNHNQNALALLLAVYAHIHVLWRCYCICNVRRKCPFQISNDNIFQLLQLRQCFRSTEHTCMTYVLCGGTSERATELRSEQEKTSGDNGLFTISPSVHSESLSHCCDSFICLPLLCNRSAWTKGKCCTPN